MKEIFLIKRENIFPDWKFFKRINKGLWNLYFSRIVRKIKDKKNPIIITDYITSSELEKYGIKSKRFGDYLESYIKSYFVAKKSVDKWFMSKYFDKIKNYKGINLCEVIDEEFAYFLEDIFDYIKVMENVIKKENPDKITIIGKLGLINKIFASYSESRGIKVEQISRLQRISDFIDMLIKKESFKARFYKFPGINRREFVKTKKNIKTSENNSIMLAGLDDTYFDRLGSVPDVLLKNKENFFDLCTNLNTQIRIREKNIPFFSFGDFLAMKDKKEIKKKEKYLKDYWKKLRGDEEFRRIFDYDGIQLFDVLEKEIESLIKIKFPWAMYYLGAIEKCFDSQKVDVVVSGDAAIMPTRAIVRMANLKGIPSLIIQNGIMACPTGYSFAPLIATKFAAWGKVSKEFMTKRGVESRRVAITGNPLSHDYRKINVGEEFFNKFKLDKNKKIILLLTGGCGQIYPEKQFVELTKVLIKMLKEFDDRQLVIKLHPREKKEIYENIARREDAKNVCIMEDNLKELISIADVIVSVGSTALLEAIALDKPIIIPNLISRPCEVPFVNFRVAKQADDEKTLKKLIENPLPINEKNREKFQNDYLFKNDKKEGERIAREIEDLRRK